MDNSSIISLQKKFPKAVGLHLSDDGQLLTITFHEPYQPIRHKNATFEVWVLLAHLKSPRTKILMKISPVTPAQAASVGYRQFLYRLSKFSVMGYGWFSLEESLAEQIQHFMETYLLTEKEFRPPYSKIPGSRDKGEHMLLTKFSNAESILHALPECSVSPIHTDLPLELFWTDPRGGSHKKSRVFPSNSKYVDLWCVKDDTLSIFNLTYQSPTVDMVSRLFFYANLCRDIFIDPTGSRIAFPSAAEKHYRGFGDFYAGGEKKAIKCINASFLSDDFYPGLDVEFICEMFTTEQIHFHMLKYSCEMPLTFTSPE